MDLVVAVKLTVAKCQLTTGSSPKFICKISSGAHFHWNACKQIAAIVIVCPTSVPSHNTLLDCWVWAVQPHWHLCTAAEFWYTRLGKFLVIYRFEPLPAAQVIVTMHPGIPAWCIKFIRVSIRSTAPGLVHFHVVSARIYAGIRSCGLDAFCGYWAGRSLFTFIDLAVSSISVVSIIALTGVIPLHVCAGGHCMAVI